MHLCPPAARGALLAWAALACQPRAAAEAAALSGAAGQSGLLAREEARRAAAVAQGPAPSGPGPTAPVADDAPGTCPLGDGSGAAGRLCPGASPARATAPEVGCASDPRVTPFAADLVVLGARHRVVVVSTEPPGATGPGQQSPQMGVNALSARIESTAGRPAPGARVYLDATMPDHAHGGSRVTGRGPGATKRFAGIDLMMPGVWQLAFTVEEGAGAADRATVHLCIPG